MKRLLAVTLLGYEREQVRGRWALESPARMILRRSMTTVPWPQLRLAD